MAVRACSEARTSATRRCAPSSSKRWIGLRPPPVRRARARLGRRGPQAGQPLVGPADAAGELQRRVRALDAAEHVAQRSVHPVAPQRRALGAVAAHQHQRGLHGRRLPGAARRPRGLQGQPVEALVEGVLAHRVALGDGAAAPALDPRRDVPAVDRHPGRPGPVEPLLARCRAGQQELCQERRTGAPGRLLAAPGRRQHPARPRPPRARSPAPSPPPRGRPRRGGPRPVRRPRPGRPARPPARAAARPRRPTWPPRAAPRRRRRPPRPPRSPAARRSPEERALLDARELAGDARGQGGQVGVRRSAQHGQAAAAGDRAGGRRERQRVDQHHAGQTGRGGPPQGHVEHVAVHAARRRGRQDGQRAGRLALHPRGILDQRQPLDPPARRARQQRQRGAGGKDRSSATDVTPQCATRTGSCAIGAVRPLQPDPRHESMRSWRSESNTWPARPRLRRPRRRRRRRDLHRDAHGAAGDRRPRARQYRGPGRPARRRPDHALRQDRRADRLDREDLQRRRGLAPARARRAAHRQEGGRPRWPPRSAARTAWCRSPGARWPVSR